MSRTLLVCLLFATPALAQDKPPKVYPPDEGTLKQIKFQLDNLNEALGKMPDSPFKPDVEVYTKAVEWVVRHEEYWDAKSGEKILAVLAAGRKRAMELVALRPTASPSWTRIRGKPVVYGYRSMVDGSVQPYSLTIPDDYDDNSERYRLDVVLHGRDATLTELKFISSREAAKPVKEIGPYIQVDVYGRGNNAFRWSGEADVFEAQNAALNRLFPRNFARINATVKVLRGFSMGGAGTWHIGLHQPFRFSAIGPGAGFSVTKGYVKNMPDPLPNYIERCLHIYDAADYAENAYHVPVIAYAGDKDPQVAATKNVQERLKKFPEIPPITFIVGKDLEHKMPPEYMAMAEAEYQKQGKARTPLEKNIRFVTYTVKNGSAAWVYVDALDRHYDRAVVEAKWDDRKPVIKTTNVRRVELFRFRWYDFGRDRPMPKEVEIDGQTLPIPEERLGMAPSPFDRRYKKVNGKWELGDVDDIPLKATIQEKRSGIQGPIDAAFMGRFFVVAASGAGWYSGHDAFLKASRDQFAHVWDKYFRAELPTKESPVDNPLLAPHTILFGDPQSNSLIAKVLPKLPITWTKDKLVVNGKSYDPATHVPVMIYPNPLSPGKYVVLNTGHTFSEKDLQGTNALLYPHLGDWAVIKPKPTKAEPWAYEVVDAGLFDEFWQFPKK